MSGDRAPRRRNPGLVPQTRLSGPMPWVIAIMIALTVIAASAGLALSNLAGNARSEIEGGVTVQIVEAAPTERDRQAELAIALLTNRDDVAKVRRVPDSELAALLEPWLGGGVDVGATVAEEDAVPMPALIDVRLAGPVTPRRVNQLRAALAPSVPSAKLDAQSAWLAPVFDAIGSLQWLAGGLIVLLAATSAAAVWLAARSALGGNRETIEIVHLLGGTDRQIARVFQRSIAIDAAVGGVIGLVIGLGAAQVLGRQFAALGSGMVAGGGLEPVDWGLLAAIPVVGVTLAVVTARITVMAALRRIL